MKANSILTQRASEVTSIADLKERYFDGEILKPQEIDALEVFDKYRVAELANSETDTAFKARYTELQIIEYTVGYQELLNQLKV